MGIDKEKIIKTINMGVYAVKQSPKYVDPPFVRCLDNRFGYGEHIDLTLEEYDIYCKAMENPKEDILEKLDKVLEERNNMKNKKATFAEWFDVDSLYYLKAYQTLQKTGMWPNDFIPENIVIEPNWQSILAFKLANKWVDYKLS